MGKWKMVPFTDIFVDVTSKATKIPKENYLAQGNYQIIDQGKNDIAGYTNEHSGIFAETPAIVFGDHTRILKYVDQPLFIGADGVKLLKSKLSDVNYRYLYYALCSVQIENTGYNRHFKWLKKSQIPLPPLDEQKRIAKNLDLASEIVKDYKDQLAELDKLVQSVFYEIFGDPVTNEKGWDCKPLSKTTQIVTGNTPPRNCKDNYGHCIEWIKTDNITDALYVTQASEYLSERGAEIGRLVDADAILMACIAGSIKSIGRVAIANRKVAFNQQINAVIANEYDTLFLYWLFRMTQRYIQSTINMSLKGILSKGKLEKLVFIAPPLPLQAHFSSIATEIEAQKAQIQQALTEAENLFNSLMQEYFE